MKLTSIISGSYLIQHNVKTGAFVSCAQSVDASEKCAKTFDLHHTYSATRPNEVYFRSL